MGHEDIETTMEIYAEVTEMKKMEDFSEITERGTIFLFAIDNISCTR